MTPFLIGILIVVAFSTAGWWIDRASGGWNLLQSPEDKFDAWLEKPLPDLEPQTDWTRFGNHISQLLYKKGDPWAKIYMIEQQNLLRASQQRPCKKCGKEFFGDHMSVVDVCGMCERLDEELQEREKARQRYLEAAKRKTRSVLVADPSDVTYFTVEQEYGSIASEIGHKEVLLQGRPLTEIAEELRGLGMSTNEIRRVVQEEYERRKEDGRKLSQAQGLWQISPFNYPNMDQRLR